MALLFLPNLPRCVPTRGFEIRRKVSCLVAVLPCTSLGTQALTSLAGRTKHKKGTMGGRHAASKTGVITQANAGIRPAYCWRCIWVNNPSCRDD